MKKTILIVLCSLMLSSCGGANQSDSGFRPPNFEEDKTLLSGEVYEINDNTLSLNVMYGSFDLNAMEQRMINPDERPSFDPENMPQEGNGRIRQEIDNPQSRPSGDPRDFGDEGMTPRGRFTGEKRDVSISEGTPIKFYSISEENQLNIADVTIMDITIGSTVNIIFETDETTIKEVQIINMNFLLRDRPSETPAP